MIRRMEPPESNTTEEDVTGNSIDIFYFLLLMYDLVHVMISAKHDQ